MEKRTWALASLLLLVPAYGTAETDSPIPASATIAEIMADFMMPAADVLWGATAIYITEQGEDDRSPKNDEEWQKVDQSRIAMEEVVTALLVPGRRAAAPGVVSEYPEEDLNPDQIEALIKREPDVWAARVHALDDTVQQAKKAIEEHDVEALTEIGGAIDDACEACHQHFWYPEQ